MTTLKLQLHYTSQNYANRFSITQVCVIIGLLWNIPCVTMLCIIDFPLIHVYTLSILLQLWHFTCKKINDRVLLKPNNRRSYSLSNRGGRTRQEWVGVSSCIGTESRHSCVTDGGQKFTGETTGRFDWFETCRDIRGTCAKRKENLW